MPSFLKSSSPDFAQRFSALVNARRGMSADVQSAVRPIIEEVRQKGDAALIAYTQKFDGVDLSKTGLRIEAAELEAAYGRTPQALRDAMTLARNRIEAHHRRQLPRDDSYQDDLGAELGSRWTAIDSVGLYVPGGKASYPSSLLMNAVPAKVAGVPRIVMVTPTPRGEVNDAVLAAAYIAGVDEVYRVGGAQAMSALAYGTETIRPVAKIVGPGNAYVAEAKRQVFGVVGIDMIAGPSEVVVVTDRKAHPAWVAADLLAQAEHDEEAQAILITDDATMADAVAAAVTAQLEIMPRGSVATKSWSEHGAVIVVGSLDEAPGLINALAPEHLELSFESASAMLPQIRNAGAIFLGHHTPEAVGDYVAGSNHVLPTARAARFSSGLGVLDFMKRTSILQLSARALEALGPATMTFAEAEGLYGHRHSVAIRLEHKG